jgi:hypothetical protein
MLSVCGSQSSDRGGPPVLGMESPNTIRCSLTRTFPKLTLAGGGGGILPRFFLEDVDREL